MIESYFPGVWTDMADRNGRIDVDNLRWQLVLDQIQPTNPPTRGHYRAFMCMAIMTDLMPGQCTLIATTNWLAVVIDIKPRAVSICKAGVYTNDQIRGISNFN